MEHAPGLAGWTTPVDGGTWPGKAKSIAAWMVTGIEAWRNLERSNGGRGSAGSTEESDRLTVHPHVRSGEIGQTASLILGGATDMLRGIAAMYFAHETFPLTRSHLPVFRSLQEHCGRVVWLLNPGTEIGAASGTIADDTAHSGWSAAFHERALRMRQLNEELLDDRLAAARKNDDTAACQQLAADGALSSRLRKRARSAASEVQMPGYSDFAELTEDHMQRLHLRVPERTRAAYGRVSETSHGTLLGLLNDSESAADGYRPFTSSEADLEMIAARSGRSWITAIAMCAGYFGWAWEPQLRAFDEAQAGLFG